MHGLVYEENSVTTPFDDENNHSRSELTALAARLYDEDLTLTTDFGWTVAALFAHMAWWDERVRVLLQRWKAQGLDDSTVDSQMINDSLKPLCHAMKPRAAVAPSGSPRIARR